MTSPSQFHLAYYGPNAREALKENVPLCFALVPATTGVLDKDEAVEVRLLSWNPSETARTAKATARQLRSLRKPDVRVGQADPEEAGFLAEFRAALVAAGRKAEVAGLVATTRMPPWSLMVVTSEDFETLRRSHRNRRGRREATSGSEEGA